MRALYRPRSPLTQSHRFLNEPLNVPGSITQQPCPSRASSQTNDWQTRGLARRVISHPIGRDIQSLCNLFWCQQRIKSWCGRLPLMNKFHVYSLRSVTVADVCVFVGWRDWRGSLNLGSALCSEMGESHALISHVSPSHWIRPSIFRVPVLVVTRKTRFGQTECSAEQFRCRCLLGAVRQEIWEAQARDLGKMLSIKSRSRRYNDPSADILCDCRPRYLFH